MLVTPARQYAKRVAGSFKGSSSNDWMRRQLNDPYVRRARVELFRCRSAYKLLEMHEKHKLLHSGMTVIDCGAAPGSWTQVLVKLVAAESRAAESSDRGRVIAFDLQHFEAVEGAHCLPETDIRNEQQLEERLYPLLRACPSNSSGAGQSGNADAVRSEKDRSAVWGTCDAVVTDMAPSATGTHSLDHEAIVDLALCALRIAVRTLRAAPASFFLAKLWMGSREQQFASLLRNYFERVSVLKPPASRSDSAEIYYLARHFREPTVNAKH